jgi:hypothetical protein
MTVVEGLAWSFFAAAPVARCFGLARLTPMSATSLPPAGPDSAQVRGQLVTSLELELIGPTQRVLKALAAAGQGLEREALDRLPSSWYITGFLVPTTTDISLRCDDTALTVALWA